jgi:tetratricopeptide (TPR) repeat protein
VAFLKRHVRATDVAEVGVARGGAGMVPVGSPGHAPNDEGSQIIAVAAAHSSAGRHSEALAAVSVALEMTPDDVELVFARGSILFAWGRHWEARTALLKSELLGLKDKTLYERLGWASMWTVGADAAEDWMRRATSAAPDDWLGHFGLGVALRLRSRTDEAIASFERALALAPEKLHCLINLAECKTAQRRLDQAEHYARRAIAVDGNSALAWTNLGVVLIAQDRFADAIMAFESAERIGAAAGSDSDQNLNLGICLRDVGRLRDALDFYARRLPERPSAGAHTHHAHALLAAGKYAEGWAQYEFRWLLQPLLARRPLYGRPVWAGQEIRGKTVLLRTEQGIGDVIQFIRYAPHVKALGATVLLQVRPGVGALAQSFPGVDRIFNSSEPLPAFDYYVHLMSLPHVFGTELASVPAGVPYLRADPARKTKFRALMAAGVGFRVGIVWAGDPDHLRDRQRSVTLEALGSLAEIPEVQFFSLQKGRAAEQVTTPPAGMRVIDLGPELRDFADTAAVIDQLDLVLSVDTSVVHLAGALGKPVWTLLPTPSDWRWLDDRDDSPWYPTMRVFRQRRQGEWPEVLARVKEALRERARAFRSGSSSADSTVAKLAEPPPLTLPARPLRSGLAPTAAAETRVGIVQYFPDQPIAGESIGWYGEYLQPQVELLAQMIKPGAIVMEVGPGVGMHVLALASAVGNLGHFFLYEARPLFRQVLRQNLSANGVANITVMQRALGERRAAERDTEEGLTSDGRDRPPFSPATETIDELRLDTLHWLKMNEDSDAPVILDGATDTLWRLRPNLFIAAPDEGAVHAIAAPVRDFGYQCWKMETPYFNPGNFNRRDSDIFSGRAALALLAIPEETEVTAALDGCAKLN